jgi:Rhodopirellula transposase DDE domain
MELGPHQPVISMDTKKKEIVGDFKNGGRELRPKGQPELVRVHDFVDPKLGRATPYGIYDLGDNRAWVSVGMDHDTAEFAVETIRRWWRTMGPGLSRGHPATDHRRRRRQQRRSPAAVENRAAKTNRRNCTAHCGLSLPAGDEQMEQDRTPAVSYITQNWRQAPPQFPGNRQSHCATTAKTGLKE